MTLDERYGRRPARHRRPLLVAGLALFVAVALAWLVWSALAIGRSSLSWSDVRVDASDRVAVAVTFEVSRSDDRPVVCAVRATDAAGQVVGWADVPVPAPGRDGSAGEGAGGTSTTTATVRTARDATGGGVASCARG